MSDVRRDQWLQLGLWGLVLILGVYFARFGVAAAVRPSHGFVAYYTAARLIREGADASLFYDDAWFRVQVARYSPAADDIYNVNPPTTALLLLPLAGLDYTRARIAWTLFSLICLVGAGGWLLWLLGLRGATIPGFIALVLLYQPLYANFHLGQVYVLLLGLLVLAWYGYRHHVDGASRAAAHGLLGFALGLMFVLKTACAPLWLLLAIQRRWHALVWTTATVLLVVVGSLPWLGIESWRTYFGLLAGFHDQPWLAVTAYQTQISFWRHLFSFDARWNPAPLFPAPVLGTWLPWLSLSLMLAVSTYRAMTTKRSNLAFASFVILSVILSPVSLDYHYVFLLVPIAILIAAGGRKRATRWAQFEAPAPDPLGVAKISISDARVGSSTIVLAVACILVASDLPYRSPQLQAGVWALLAYPKLYGALALWALALAKIEPDGVVR